MRLLAAGKYNFLPGLTEDWDSVEPGEIPSWWDFDVPSWDTITKIETGTLEWPPGSGTIYSPKRKLPKEPTIASPEKLALGWMEILAISMASIAGVAGVGILVQAMIRRRVKRLHPRGGPPEVEMMGTGFDDDVDDDDDDELPMGPAPGGDYGVVPDRSVPVSNAPSAASSAELERRLSGMTLDDLAGSLETLNVKNAYFKPMFPFGSRIDAMVNDEIPTEVIFSDHPDDSWDELPLAVKRYYLEFPTGSEIATYLVQVLGGSKVVERRLFNDPCWCVNLDPYLPKTATIEDMVKRKDLEKSIGDLQTVKLEAELKKLQIQAKQAEADVLEQERASKEVADSLARKNKGKEAADSTSSNEKLAITAAADHAKRIADLEERKVKAEEELAAAQMRNMETAAQRWSGHAMDALSTVAGFGIMGRLSRPSVASVQTPPTPTPAARTTGIPQSAGRGRVLGGASWKGPAKTRSRPRPGR
jgi:hypothetical protein